MAYTGIYISLANNMEIKKYERQTLSGVKKTYRLDRIVQERGNCILYYLLDEPDRAFASEELMRIPEDTQVPPEWVSKWK